MYCLRILMMTGLNIFLGSCGIVQFIDSAILRFSTSPLIVRWLMRLILLSVTLMRQAPMQSLARYPILLQSNGRWTFLMCARLVWHSEQFICGGQTRLVLEGHLSLCIVHPNEGE